MKFQQSIIIGRPVNQVFAYRSLLRNAMEWQREVLAIEADPVDTTGLGARAVEQRRGANGTTEEWELQITEFEPDHVLGICGQSGATLVTERHEFVSADSDTRYTLTVELTGS